MSAPMLPGCVVEPVSRGRKLRPALHPVEWLKSSPLRTQRADEQSGANRQILLGRDFDSRLDNLRPRSFNRLCIALIRVLGGEQGSG
jgi:hypothetical protein